MEQNFREKFFNLSFLFFLGLSAVTGCKERKAATITLEAWGLDPASVQHLEDNPAWEIKSMEDGTMKARCGNCSLDQIQKFPINKLDPKIPWGLRMYFDNQEVYECFIEGLKQFDYDDGLNLICDDWEDGSTCLIYPEIK